MPSESARLGLLRHTTADNFRTVELTDNWNALDNHPGVFICDSDSRPTTWGAAHNGMLIFERNTKLAWVWNGTAFERFYGKGRLGVNERMTDISNTSTALAVAVQTTVTIPDGNRPVMVIVEGPGVYGTQGLTRLTILRAGTVLQSWVEQGKTGPNALDQPRPVQMTCFDAPTAGSVAYSLQFAAEPAFGGTVTLEADTNTPLAIHVVEI